MSIKILTIATVPDYLVGNEWLQHLRNFDTTHPGCHFEVIADTLRDIKFLEVIEMMCVEPELTLMQILKRHGIKAEPDQD